VPFRFVAVTSPPARARRPPVPRRGAVRIPQRAGRFAVRRGEGGGVDQALAPEQEAAGRPGDERSGPSRRMRNANGDLEGEAAEIDVRLDGMAVVARAPPRGPGRRGIGDETMRRAFPCGLEPAAELAGGALVDGAERLRRAAVERAL